jgi:hypothetical protein
MLLRVVSPSDEPDVWSARADFRADADQVLAALTDPVQIARWAPVRFDVEGLAGGRLSAGSRERVSGSLAGVNATFQLEVIRADTDGLELVANGPVSFDVAYSFRDRGSKLAVEARVALRRQRGLAAQVLRAAVSGLLNAGALARALQRLESSVSEAFDAELVAA